MDDNVAVAVAARAREGLPVDEAREGRCQGVANQCETEENSGKESFAHKGVNVQMYWQPSVLAAIIDEGMKEIDRWDMGNSGFFISFVL